MAAAAASLAGSMTLEDVLFFLGPAPAGAVCGDLYWRMAVKLRPAPDRSEDPPMGEPTG